MLGRPLRKRKMIKSYKFKLYPNQAQGERLRCTLSMCAELYNACLEQRKIAWRDRHISISVYQQKRELPDLKAADPRWKEIYSSVLQDTVFRVDSSFQHFFRRVKQKNGKAGFPRFRSWRRYDSFTYSSQQGVKLVDNRLHLSKIGNIKIKLHRPIEGQIKTCTLKREIDEWYVVFSCELPEVPAVPIQSEIGLDMGIESFLTTSEGEKIENPRPLKESLKALRRAHRSLSRKQRGSKRRQKQVKRVAKTYRQVTRQRRDFQFNLAKTLVSQYDALYVEDLQVSNMVRNHSLAQAISDVSWSSFLSALAFKAECAGKQVIFVNPQHTSQACSGCGSIVKKDLAVRWHTCPDCGLSLHRDHNAAINIMSKGRGHRLQALTDANGQNVV